MKWSNFGVDYIKNKVPVPYREGTALAYPQRLGINHASTLVLYSTYILKAFFPGCRGERGAFSTAVCDKTPACSYGTSL